MYGYMFIALVGISLVGCKDDNSKAVEDAISGDTLMFSDFKVSQTAFSDDGYGLSVEHTG